MSDSIVRRSLCVILSLVFLPAPRLAAGQNALAAGQSHFYQIKLTAGQYLRFTAEQRAVDVTISLPGPDGLSLAQADVFRRGAESLSLIRRMA
jgi:hypothetical protein